MRQSQADQFFVKLSRCQSLLGRYRRAIEAPPLTHQQQRVGATRLHDDIVRGDDWNAGRRWCKSQAQVGEAATEVSASPGGKTLSGQHPLSPYAAEAFAAISTCCQVCLSLGFSSYSFPSRPFSLKPPDMAVSPKLPAHVHSAIAHLKIIGFRNSGSMPIPNQRFHAAVRFADEEVRPFEPNRIDQKGSSLCP